LYQTVFASAGEKKPRRKRISSRWSLIFLGGVKKESCIHFWFTVGQNVGMQSDNKKPPDESVKPTKIYEITFVLFVVV